MRKSKALLTILNELVKLLSEEAERNSDFANRLDAVLGPLETPKRTTPKQPTKLAQVELPDIHSEFAARGESEFRLWLRELPVVILHALVRRHDLDATRRSSKWKDPEKLSGYITDQLRSRFSRGSAFLSKSEMSADSSEGQGD
jgi:hypothetical protein